MGKIKIHEIAKKLGLTSKEVLEKAQKLKIDVKSHMSGVEEEEAKKIENSFSKNEDQKKSTSTTQKKEEKTHVIIRREVIVADEEKKKQADKRQETRNNIGFVERKQNKDYNIVYRNKPNKPKTVDELFGLKKEPEKQQEKQQQKEPEKQYEEVKTENEKQGDNNNKMQVELVKKPSNRVEKTQR